MEDLHGDHKGLGIVFDVGLGDLAMARVDHAEPRQIHQNHVFGNIDVGQIDLGLVDEQYVGIVLGDIVGQFVQGDFLGRPAQFVPTLDQGFEFVKEFLFIEGAVLRALPLYIAIETGDDLGLTQCAVGIRAGPQFLGYFLEVEVLQFRPFRFGQVGYDGLVRLALAYQRRDGGQGLCSLRQNVIAQHGVDDGALAGGECAEKGNREFRRFQPLQPGAFAADVILEVLGDIEVRGCRVVDFEQSAERADVMVVIRLFHRLSILWGPGQSGRRCRLTVLPLWSR